MISKMFLRVTAAAAALAVAPQAQAVTFVLNSTINTSTLAGANAQRGFQFAAAYWSSVLTDTSTVRLNIGFNSLGAGILGSTGSTRAVYGVNDIYGALAADATSLTDLAAVTTLSPLGASTFAGRTALTVTTNALNPAGTGYLDTATRVDSDGGANNSFLAVNTANAKALGAADTGAADGSVTFSSNFGFDFDPSDGIDSDKYDFIGVAIHEIGHALGFVSGVDTYDAYTAPGATNTKAGALEVNAVASVLDLFRYSSAGTLDWTTQGQAYFSIDGGVSQLYGDSRLEMGAANGGRGRQASHWYDSVAGAPQLGILDPTSGNGQMQAVTGLDLAAFDAMGYNIAASARDNGAYRVTTANIYSQFQAQVGPAVPEPATWAMMIAGFGLVGGAMRRRRTSVAFA